MVAFVVGLGVVGLGVVVFGVVALGVVGAFVVFTGKIAAVDEVFLLTGGTVGAAELKRKRIPRRNRIPLVSQR